MAVNDSSSTVEDTAIQIDLITNDVDMDGDVLFINSVTQPANGIVVISSTMVVTYTPAAGFLGDDTFTYTVSDGVLTDTATVTVTVETAASWYPLGSGLPDSVRTLARVGADLFVSGNFRSIPNCEGGVDTACRHIARWDGANWHPLHMGMDYSQVNSLVHHGSDLYVGGGFSSIPGCVGGDNLCQAIARWDGSNWHPLMFGISGQVSTMFSYGLDLYVGGFFPSIPGCVGGDTLCQNIARWDGSNWHSVNNEVDGIVSSMAVNDSGLFIGGSFENIPSCVGGAERCRKNCSLGWFGLASVKCRS